MSIDASLGIGDAAGKSWIDAAEAIGVCSKDCDCFVPLVGKFVLELPKKMLRLQLS